MLSLDVEPIAYIEGDALRIDICNWEYSTLGIGGEIAHELYPGIDGFPAQCNIQIQ